MNGIIIIIPANCTTSGRRSRSPMRPNRALIAPASTTSTRRPAAASTAPPWKPEARAASAAAIRMAARATVNTVSLMVRASPGRPRGMGRVAKRSWRPLVWSMAAATPALVPAITVVTASMAGVRKSM